ncbi:MAG TPA: nucleotide exchange factor GrpE [Thermoanaerobaculia bacterium]|jgi:molecular chaperone GrpE|nr:nucleotide exchange factor GrpE [Thermoanaerobaculia bacterium]
MDENSRTGGDDADDTYIIEDTGSSIEEIEREMREAAQEAVSDEPADPSAAAPGSDEALRQENQDLKNRYLRTLADFDNLRKRTEREKADFFRYATSAVLKDLLPVLDNFDRAMEHSQADDEFHKGVELIYKQLYDVLFKHGLRPIDEVGVHFDPNIHEAVVREEDSSVPSHTVTAMLQKGYFLHDRLLRPALVKVAVGGPDQPA